MPPIDQSARQVAAQVRVLADRIHDERDRWEQQRRPALQKDLKEHEEFLRRSRENAGKRVFGASGRHGVHHR